MVNSGDHEINQEQLFHDLEQKYLELKRIYDIVEEQRDKAYGDVATLQSSLNEANNKLSTIEKNFDAKVIELKQMDTILEETRKAEDALSESLRKRISECDTLREDLSKQSETLMNTERKMRELQGLLNTNENEQFPVQFELTKTQREKESLERQVTWLETELKTKSNEWLATKQALIIKGADTDSQLTTEKADNASKSQQIICLQSRIQSQDQKIDQYMKRAGELEHEMMVMRNNYDNELDSQKKLADLYKRNLEEANEIVTSSEQKAANALDQYEGIKSTLDRLVDEAVAKTKQESQEMLKVLEDKLVEVESRPTGSNDSSDGSFLSLSNLPSNFSGISSYTDLFDRVATSEKTANSLRAKNKELENYLSRIMKDIERKAPQIANLKLDYHRVLESNTLLSNRHDLLLSENSRIKEQLCQAEDVMQQQEDSINSLRASNSDLSKQIQHLLKLDLQRSISVGNREYLGASGVAVVENDEANEVLSNHMVLFDSVEDLQKQNEQLLKTVRSFSVKDTSAANKRASSETTTSLVQSLQQELNSLKEQRKQSEDIMMQIVHQRDMYRSMYEDVNAGRGTVAGSSLPTTPLAITVGPDSTPNSASPNDNKGFTVELLKSQLSDAKEQIDALNKRLNRTMDAESMLNESLDKCKGEVYDIQLSNARLLTDIRYQTERNERLEQLSTSNELMVAELAQKRAELEGMIINLQKDCSAKDDKILALSDSVRRANEGMQRKEIDLEVLRSAEARYIEQIADLREDMKRQATLLDSVHRIEMGLSAKAEEDKVQLRESIESLTKQNESLRNEISEKSILFEHKILTMQETIKLQDSQHSSVDADYEKTKEECVRQTSLVAALRERVDALEKQLAASNDRIISVSSARSGSDSGETPQAVTAIGGASDVILERVQSEVVSLQSQLDLANKHMQEYKQISVANEAMCKELQERAALTKIQYEQDLAAKNDEYESAMKLLNENKSTSMTAVIECEQVKDELQMVKSQLKNVVTEWEQKYSAIASENSTAHGEVKAMKTEFDALQAKYTESQDNYRREVQMHSATAREMDELQVTMKQLRTEHSTMLDKYTALSTTSMQLENQLREEKERNESNSLESRNRIADLLKSNSSLLDQVSALGNQVEKLQSDRLSLNSGVSLAQTFESGKEGSSGVDSNEEVMTLRKSLSELREVLGYMKKDRELSEAKLALVESERNRLTTTVSITQRALDEVRAEQRLNSEGSGVHSEEQFSKMVADVNEINIVRESNAHLRSENEALNKSLSNAKISISELTDSLSPLKSKIAALEQDKARMEGEREALVQDAAYWKNRLHLLVSRYNDVDPEEHRLLQVKCDNLAEELSTSESALKTLQEQFDGKVEEFITLQSKVAAQEAALKKKIEADCEARIASLTAELEAAKKSALSLQKSFTTSFKKKTSEEGAKHSRDMAEMEKKLDDTKAELANMRTEKDSVVSQSEKLRTALRTRMQQLDEQKKKVTELSKEIKLLNSASASASAVETSVDTAITVADKEPVPAAATAPGTEAASDPKTEEPTVVEETPVSAAAAAFEGAPVKAVAVDGSVISVQDPEAIAPSTATAAGSSAPVPASTAPTGSNVPVPASTAPASSSAPVPASAAPASSSAPVASSAPVPANRKRKEMEKGSCKSFWLTGSCRFGASCKFKHISSDASPAVSATGTAAVINASSASKMAVAEPSTETVVPPVSGRKRKEIDHGEASEMEGTSKAEDAGNITKKQAVGKLSATAAPFTLGEDKPVNATPAGTDSSKPEETEAKSKAATQAEKIAHMKSMRELLMQRKKANASAAAASSAAGGASDPGVPAAAAETGNVATENSTNVSNTTDKTPSVSAPSSSASDAETAPADPVVEGETKTVFLDMRPPSPVPDAAIPVFGSSTVSSTGWVIGKAAPGGVFGTNAASSAPTVGGLFGNATSAKTGLFGSISSTPAPGGLFGNATSAKTGLFGCISSTPATGGLFGTAVDGAGHSAQPVAKDVSAQEFSSTRSIFDSGAADSLKLNIDPPAAAGSLTASSFSSFGGLANSASNVDVVLLGSSKSDEGGPKPPKPFSIEPSAESVLKESNIVDIKTSANEDLVCPEEEIVDIGDDDEVCGEMEMTEAIAEPEAGVDAATTTPSSTKSAAKLTNQERIALRSKKFGTPSKTPGGTTKT